jgi:signal transduction histidine kinase
LEDSAPDHLLLCRALDKAKLFYSITRVDTLHAFAQSISNGLSFDVILADYRLNGFTAMDGWAAMQTTNIRAPFILVSGAIGEELAVEAVRLGISDFVNKADLGRLALVIDRALTALQAQSDKETATRALAVSQKRLTEFTEHLQATIEAERASIAREIHDDIGGSLVAAKLDVAWVARHVPDQKIQSHLASAQEMLKHAMGASQRIMMALRPSILDQGLVPAVEWLVEGFSKRTGIPARISAKGQFSLSKDIELVAYRTTQEALTNASKYANCSVVQVDISDEESVLTVEVNDDGIGIPDAAKENTAGFGLRGLQERARTVGGWLDISSTPGNGTSIILSVPLKVSRAESDWDVTT